MGHEHAHAHTHTHTQTQRFAYGTMPRETHHQEQPQWVAARLKARVAAVGSSEVEGTGGKQDGQPHLPIFSAFFTNHPDNLLLSFNDAEGFRAVLPPAPRSGPGPRAPLASFTLRDRCEINTPALGRGHEKYLGHNGHRRVRCRHAHGGMGTRVCWHVFGNG